LSVCISVLDPIVYFILREQGGPDRKLFTKDRLIQDENGFTPLYQAAMCLMEEVSTSTTLSYMSDTSVLMYGIVGKFCIFLLWFPREV